MLTKTQPDEIQDYLADASYLKGGHAARVFFPESAADVAEILRAASRDRTAVTISGAGTGTVGGRVPFGGVVLATNKLDQIDVADRRCRAQAGARLSEVQAAVDAHSLFYPPDPTERSCFLGGTIATNASGARTFKYGPTRNYVGRLKVVLATGDTVDLARGEIFADASGELAIPVSSGKLIKVKLPTYSMPHVRKHASGYFVAPGMDAIDLFVGSEGTLGVIVDAELKLLPKPAGLLTGVVFFDKEDRLLGFVSEARQRSLGTRQYQGNDIDARAIEYFDVESLKFLRTKYDSIPETATGAIFFEQETAPATEDALMSEWLSLVERHQALADQSWFATNETDQAKLKEFRHALPVLMNEWFARYKQRKVSTDMSVPDEAFAGMLSFYRDSLMGGDLRYTIFGHIGDNHVHVNILPRDEAEAAKAWDIYRSFIRRAVEVGGTISAEHGIGKLKREYLAVLYGEQHLREMAALKRTLDPAGILGRGNIFAEEYLADISS